MNYKDEEVKQEEVETQEPIQEKKDEITNPKSGYLFPNPSGEPFGVEAASLEEALKAFEDHKKNHNKEQK